MIPRTGREARAASQAPEGTAVTGGPVRGFL